MAVDIDDVRIELQLSAEVLSDESIDYAIDKLSDMDDINLVCAECLRMLLRKHRGLTERRIGKYNEIFSPTEIRNQINEFMGNSATGSWDDGFQHPDPFFTRKGI
jgi:hypothetical protein